MSEPMDRREVFEPEKVATYTHSVFGGYAPFVSLEDYQRLLAANREKDYEIERLKGCVENLDRQLASLRASGGEKWIDVRKTPPTAPDIDYWCYVEPRDSYYFDVPGYEHQTEKGTWKPVQKKVRTYKTKTGEIKFNCGCSEEVTYYQPLPAPPTLTREKE